MLRLAPIGIAVFLTSAPTVAATNTPPVVRVGVDLVQIDAVVTDREGRMVGGLGAKDFEILEDGRPQAITHCEYVRVGPPPSPEAPPGPPRILAFILDDVGLRLESNDAVRAAIARFADEQMQPTDLVAIGRTARATRILQQFTGDKRLVHAALEDLRRNPAAQVSMPTPAPGTAAAENPGAPSLVFSPMADSGAEREIEALRRQILNDTVFDGLETLVAAMGAMPGRKAMVLLSDRLSLADTRPSLGRPTRPQIDPGLLDALQRITELANRLSVVVYSIAPGHRASSDASLDGLAVLARETGGLYLHTGNDVSLAVRKAVEDQQGYYVIGYTPDAESFDTKEGRAPYHKVLVRVRPTGLVVRSRAGFFGITDEDARRAARSTGGQLTAAAVNPMAPVGLALQVSTLVARTDGRASVRAEVRLPGEGVTIKDDAAGPHVELDLLGLVFDAKGELVHQVGRDAARVLRATREEVTLSFEVPLEKPGLYQLRVAVRDAATGRLGSARQTVEVTSAKALAAPAAPPADVVIAPTVEHYAGLLTLARDGDARTAVAGVLDWSASQIERAKQSLLDPDGRCPDICRVAVLVHTEAAFILMQLGRAEGQQAHVRAAQSLLSAPPAPVASRDALAELETRWRLAVGHLNLQSAQPRLALSLYQMVLKKHPADAEALVAVGALFEYLTVAPRLRWHGTGGRFGMSTDFEAAEAARYYALALQARPEDAEARLRLGRISVVRGRREDAARELGRVAAQSSGGLIGAYAHFFLGDLAEREQRGEGAIAEYRRALEIEPRLQPAQLALSHALQRAGRGAEATAALRSGLEATRDGRVEGWYAYHVAALHGFRHSMDRLWASEQR